MGTSDEVVKEAENLYTTLIKKGIDVLYDDRELSAGEKLADADLLGVPLRLVVSEKTIANNKWELKYRRTGEVEFVSTEDLLGKF